MRPRSCPEAVVALDRLSASVDRLKLLAASLPDCGKEPQIRRERMRVRRLIGLVAGYEDHPVAGEEIARAIDEAAYESDVPILQGLRACRDQRELEQAAQ